VQNPDVGHDTTDSVVGGVPTSGREGSAVDAESAPSAEDLGRLIDTTEAAAASADASAASLADGARAEPGATPGGGELDGVRAELAERTADLQRVSAEYTNYRRRVERDREATVAGAKAQVASDLLTVLDDVDRAENHGDLTGPFKVVGDRLRESLQRAGLVSFGAEGDPFDPNQHEAVAQETSAEVSGPTVTTVMRRGYRFGERVLRPAMVAVTDNDGSAPSADQVSAGSDRPQG
jgi:molecular chaperone GrpE